MDELGRVYGYALGVLAGDDEDALDAAYGTRLLRSDGRIAAVGDWTAADLAAMHARAGRDTSNEQSSATSETTRRRDDETTSSRAVERTEQQS